MLLNAGSTIPDSREVYGVDDLCRFPRDRWGSRLVVPDKIQQPAGSLSGGFCFSGLEGVTGCSLLVAIHRNQNQDSSSSRLVESTGLVESVFHEESL